MNARTLAVVMLAGAILASGVAFARDDQTAAPTSWSPAEMKKGYVVFEYTTMKNLTPAYVPARDDVVKKVSCALARDEYESIQFGVHALADIKAIDVEVESDLRVTVYHRITPSVKQQLADVPRQMGEVGRWMPSEIHLQRGSVFPELGKDKSVNFWLTFQADEETKAGLHRGKVRIKPAGRPETVLDLEVTVRPFKLERPRIPFVMWMREDMLPKRFGGLATPDETVLAIYRDMAEHGQNSGAFYPPGNWGQLPPKNDHSLEKLVPLAQRAGLLDPDIPCYLYAPIAGLEDEQKREAAAVWLRDECRRQGWPEMIVFSHDEPPYPQAANNVRKNSQSMRGVPIRTNIDLSSTGSTYGYNTPGISDVQTTGEMTDREGPISPEMQAEMERLGIGLWVYSYSLWREACDPLRERYFAGLYTWAYKLGGNSVWAYHHGHHRHAWFPPDSHEPMPVTGWETRREGVDDYRYLQMVGDCVAANPDEPLAAEAAKWLEDLRARVRAVDSYKVEPGKPLTFGEYDEIRMKAAGYIQELGPVPNESIVRPPVTPAKDEAAPYRGKSVQECMAGLASADVSERRAAAWALYELGPKAAAATEALARALDDPEVRMPALHALEAIGPGAVEAVPGIAGLLEHDDFYVRTGAVFALGAIGCPMDKLERDGRRFPSPHASAVVEPMLVALLDDNPGVSEIAANVFHVMGPLAKPAVPVAIEMLDDASLHRRGAALRIITGAGPEAAAAVPKLAELHENDPGNAFLINALAAIGPAASAAVPALKAYAARENPGAAQVDSYYALFCIRGKVSDLRKMVAFLKDERVNALTKNYTVKRLNELGPEAEPVADELGRLTQAGKFVDKKRESAFGKTPSAEARYVDGADCLSFVSKLRVAAKLPVAGWRFKDDPKGIGVEQGYFKPDALSGDLPEITVTDVWDNQGYKGLGEGWYRIQYTCPDLPEGKRVFLHFESVDESAWLYVDGKLVAWYDTAYPVETWNRSFLLDVTGNLKSRGTHLLAIRVHSVSGDGGIYRPVSLMVEK